MVISEVGHACATVPTAAAANNVIPRIVLPRVLAVQGTPRKFHSRTIFGHSHFAGNCSKMKLWSL